MKINADNKEEENKELKKLSSTHHTLFKTEVKGTEESKKKGFYKKVPGYTQYRFFVDSFMEFEKELHSIYNELWDADENDRLELRINSRGGLVNEGAQFYSIIKNKFNGRCTTVLDNCGYSMGAITFLMGDERIATERSDLMLHDYSGGTYGKGGEQKSQLEHSQKHIRQFFKEVLLGGNYITKKEYKNMLIGQDYWMDVVELCKRGMATHVLVNGEKITAKKYLKKYLKKENK